MEGMNRSSFKVLEDLYQNEVFRNLYYIIEELRDGYAQTSKV